MVSHHAPVMAVIIFWLLRTAIQVRIHIVAIEFPILSDIDFLFNNNTLFDPLSLISRYEFECTSELAVPGSPCRPFSVKLQTIAIRVLEHR